MWLGWASQYTLLSQKLFVSAIVLAVSSHDKTFAHVSLFYPCSKIYYVISINWAVTVIVTPLRYKYLSFITFYYSLDFNSHPKYLGSNPYDDVMTTEMTLKPKLTFRPSNIVPTQCWILAAGTEYNITNALNFLRIICYGDPCRTEQLEVISHCM